MSKKERSPAMQFYFRQFSGDESVQLMDLDTVGCHILLMCAAGASSHGYRLAYDLGKLRRLFRNPLQQDFDRILSQLLDGAWKISDDGLWLEQEGMKKTLRKQREFSKKQSANSMKRWASQTDPKSMPEVSQTVSQTDPKSMPSSSSSSSSSKVQKKHTKKVIRQEKDAGKTIYGENLMVLLSDDEHIKLTLKYGANSLNHAIDVLDAWIFSKPGQLSWFQKNYSSAFSVMNPKSSWVWEKIPGAFSKKIISKQEQKEQAAFNLINKLREQEKNGKIGSGGTVNSDQPSVPNIGYQPKRGDD